MAYLVIQILMSGRLPWRLWGKYLERVPFCWLVSPAAWPSTSTTSRHSMTASWEKPSCTSLLRRFHFFFVSAETFRLSLYCLLLLFVVVMYYWWWYQIVLYVLVLGLIEYIRKVLDCCSDGSVNVRLQAVIALSKFFSQTPHLNCTKKVALAVNQRNADRARHRHPSSSPSGCAADSSRWCWYICIDIQMYVCSSFMYIFHLFIVVVNIKENICMNIWRLWV